MLGAAALIAVGVVVGAMASTLLDPTQPSTNPSSVASPTIDLGPTSTPGPVATLITPVPLPTADAEGRYADIDGIACDELEHTEFHIHAHLTIRFGGEVSVIPGTVGIRDVCFYWIHTHAIAGVIHVEAPRDTSPTLGEFFDIWGQILAERQVLDRPLQPDEGLYVYLNGERFEGDPRAIGLENLMTIEIQVGTAPFTPLPYEWSPDFR